MVQRLNVGNVSTRSMVNVFAARSYADVTAQQYKKRTEKDELDLDGLDGGILGGHDDAGVE